MSEIVYRPAVLDDAADIHALLLALAPEMPLLVDTLEREEALYALTRRCARSGETWVACTAGGDIVGFVLAELAQHARHYAEHEVVELHHAGVAASYRGRGIFGELVGRLQARLLPITTRVAARNRAGAADRLAALGFRASDTAGGEAPLRWEPGTASGS